MNIETKIFVAQNPMLTALLIWRFARAYVDADPAALGPPLPKAMIALAIQLHRRSVETIKDMQRPSGLLKALNDEPLIRLGLQERLEAFGPAVFGGINIAAAAKLLTLSFDSPGWPTLSPNQRPKGIPLDLRPISDTVNDMLKAGDRLGPWFTAYSVPTLCSMLQVRF